MVTFFWCSLKSFFQGLLAGVIEETEAGYHFSYDEEYLSNEEKWQVSKTLPISEHPYSSKTIFPFFDGLIPEGWLLDVAVDNWKLKANDRMGLLIAGDRCVFQHADKRWPWHLRQMLPFLVGSLAKKCIFVG